MKLQRNNIINNNNNNNNTLIQGKERASQAHCHVVIYNIMVSQLNEALEAQITSDKQLQLHGLIHCTYG